MTPLQKAAKNLLEIFYTTGKPIDVYVYDLRRAFEAEQTQQAAVPMTDEQIDEIALQEGLLLICDDFDALKEITRAVEAHHGIGAKQ